MMSLVREKMLIDYPREPELALSCPGLCRSRANFNESAEPPFSSASDRVGELKELAKLA
jgi:hypothetical protein